MTSRGWIPDPSPKGLTGPAGFGQKFRNNVQVWVEFGHVSGASLLSVVLQVLFNENIVLK